MTPIRYRDSRPRRFVSPWRGLPALEARDSALEYREFDNMGNIHKMPVSPSILITLLAMSLWRRGQVYLNLMAGGVRSLRGKSETSETR